MLRFSSLKLVEHQNKTRLVASLTRQAQSVDVWYEVDNIYRDQLNDTFYDPFVLAFYLDAALSGESIEVEGAVSARLLYGLNHYFNQIIRLSYPSSHAITVSASVESDFVGKQHSGIAATGFSGGVDSFSTLINHQNHVPKSYQIEALLLNFVGAKMTDNTVDRLSHAAKALSLPLIQVRSNIDAVLTTDYVNDHLLRNYSCAVIFQGMLGKYYYSSAYRYEDCRIRPAYNGLSYCEPMLGSLISTNQLEFIPTGHQLSRVEKTQQLVTHPVAQRYLDVCVNPSGTQNCSVCEKCVRTQFTLELLGHLDDFSGVFDQQKYFPLKDYFVAQLYSKKHDPLAAEILQLMQQKHYRPSTKVKLISILWRIFPDTIKNLVKGLLSRLKWNGFQA